MVTDEDYYTCGKKIIHTVGGEYRMLETETETRENEKEMKSKKKNKEKRNA